MENTQVLKFGASYSRYFTVIVLLETQGVQSIAQEDKLSFQISSKYNTHNKYT